MHRVLRHRARALVLVVAAAACTTLAAVAAVQLRGSTGVSTDTATVATQLPADCGQVSGADPASFECMGDLLIKMLDAHGVDVATAALGVRFANGAGDAMTCHSVAHALGWAAASSYEPSRLVVLEPGVCLEGYTHGVLEGFAHAATDDAFWDGTKDVCASFTKDSYDLSRCAHGLGHALSVRRFGGFVETIEACDVLHDESAMQTCAIAVQMSFTTTAGDQNGALRPVEDRPSALEYPSLCRQLSDRYAPGCWGGLWQAYEPTWSYDRIAEQLVLACNTAGVFTDRCFQGLGFAAFNRVGSYAVDADALYTDAVAALGRCRVAGEFLADCARGVSYASANRWVNLSNTMVGYKSPCPTLPQEAVEACIAMEEQFTDWVD